MKRLLLPLLCHIGWRNGPRAAHEAHDDHEGGHEENLKLLLRALHLRAFAVARDSGIRSSFHGSGKAGLLVVAVGVAVLLTPVLSKAQLFTLTKEQMIQYTAQNPFDRFPDGRPMVPDSLIERARALSAEEVFAILPGKGFRNQFEDG